MQNKILQNKHNHVFQNKVLTLCTYILYNDDWLPFGWKSFSYMRRKTPWCLKSTTVQRW